MSKVRQSCTFHTQNVQLSHTEDGNLCARRFWSTLRPLIAFLIFILFIGMGVLVGGGWAKKAKAKLKKKSKQTKQDLGGRLHKNKHKHCKVL